MSSKSDFFLKKTLGDDFFESLAKVELWKPGTRSTLDHEEIKTALQIVPRTMMNFLIQELRPMAVNDNKEIGLPISGGAMLRITKHDRDVYSGTVEQENKVVVDFKYRSLPSVGLVIMSAFELYDKDAPEQEVSKDVVPDAEEKVQKLIEERLAFHALVHAVVDKKMLQQDAVKELILSRVTEQLKQTKEELETERIRLAGAGVAALGYVKPGDITPDNPYHSASLDDVQRLYAEKERLRHELAASNRPEEAVNPEIRPFLKSVDEKAKKGSPVVAFIEGRKEKLKKSEFSIVLAKGETINCPDCQKAIFTETAYSGCICFGDDRKNKVHIRKSDTGCKVSFPASWDEENIEMLLQILRKQDV